MNTGAHPAAQPLVIGTPMEGGFYIGHIMLPDGPPLEAGVVAGDGVRHTVHGLIKAPKSLGDFADMEWGPYGGSVDGALSFNDGLSNTLAMAKAGSKLAQRILDLHIGDKNDWYLPALDELEIAYRNCKPGTRKNYMYMRSGINLYAIPATHPYTADEPAQTAVEIFRKGGAEAFEEEAVYWTSTQSADDSDSAWCQYFNTGTQLSWLKGRRCRGCAVRRFKI